MIECYHVDLRKIKKGGAISSQVIHKVFVEKPILCTAKAGYSVEDEKSYVVDAERSGNYGDFVGNGGRGKENYDSGAD